MIIKLVKAQHRNRANLDGLVNYLTANKSRVAEVGYQHIYPKDPKLVSLQMECATKCYAKTISKIPYKHYVLSWEEDKEKYYPVASTQLVRDFCKEMGLHNCQYFFVKHQDTANPHIHLIVNRIDMINKKPIIFRDEMGFEINRIHQVREKLEMKYKIGHEQVKKQPLRGTITQQEFLKKREVRQVQAIEKLITMLDRQGYDSELLSESHWKLTKHPKTGESILANKALKIYIRQAELELLRTSRRARGNRVKLSIVPQNRPGEVLP